MRELHTPTLRPNVRRHVHSSLDGQTPDQAYFRHDSLLPIRSAA
jgi:hypothetical protein